MREFEIGILRSIKQNQVLETEIEKGKQEAMNSLRNSIVQGYNNSMMKKYPVKVNEKLFSNNQS
jgi:hypothetical protein